MEFPSLSLTLPLMITVYVVPLVKGESGVKYAVKSVSSYSTLPLMFSPFFKTMNVFSFIDSSSMLLSNLTLILMFGGTSVAPAWGSVEIIWGDVFFSSRVYKPTSGSPKRFIS